MVARHALFFINTDLFYDLSATHDKPDNEHDDEDATDSAADDRAAPVVAATATEENE